MHIHDSHTLLNHIRAGATFQVRQGELKTLDGVARHWARLLDHFRPASALAAREARVLAAMTEMLRPQSFGGPRDLTAEPPRSGMIVRQRLGEARTAFMTALVQAGLERETAQPNRHSRLTGFSPAERNLLGTALGEMLGAASVTGQSSLRDMQALAQSAVIQAGQAVDTELLTVLAHPDAQLPDPAVYRERMEQTLQNALSEALGQSWSFTADDLHRDAISTLIHERPSINGFRVAGNAESSQQETRIVSDYSQMLDAFCRSPLEKRVLSYLLAQGSSLTSALFPPRGESPRSESSLTDSSFSDRSSLLSGASSFSRTGPRPTVLASGEAQCSLSRNHNGDSILDFTIPLSVPGRLLTIALPDGESIEIGPSSAPLVTLRSRLVVPLLTGNTAYPGPPLPLGPRPQREPAAEALYQTPRSVSEAIYQTPRSVSETLYQSPRAFSGALYENIRDTSSEPIYETMDFEGEEAAPTTIVVPLLFSEITMEKTDAVFTRL